MMKELTTRSRIVEEMAQRRKDLEESVVRMIVNCPTTTYREIGKVMELHPVRIAQIAAKHGVQRPKGGVRKTVKPAV
jgi:hypothetical protein